MVTTPVTVKVSAIRQVSIPKAIYEELGISPGDRLIVTLEDGKIILEPSTIVAKTRTAVRAKLRKGAE